MTDAPTPAPDKTICDDDPGDETARRYRFQWTWAAITCCMLLDNSEDVQEVFCEHHEDILLRHRDGSFSGHQVKTREDNLPPWRASDEAVLTACMRFAKLESDFPGQFRRFCFLSNHPLHCARNSQDLNHVLKTIKDSTAESEPPQKIKGWVKRIARDAGVEEAIVRQAMSKTIASADLPKLRDALVRLINTITQCWPPANECSYEAVKRSARELVEACTCASSLDHEQLLPAYILSHTNENADIARRILGKRMTLSCVQSILEQGRDSKATLEGDPLHRVSPGEGSTDLLHSKLDAAGFSAVSRASAEDLRNKADYLGIKWIRQHGNSKGLKRYDHIRTIVLSDAGQAFDATQTVADGFGPAMREDLRRRLRERRITGDQLYDTTDEHLEGVAFSLTAQCKVAWSHARPWEEE